MGFVDKLGMTIATVSKDVGQKARDTSGIAKLKLDIRMKKEFIKEQYAMVGKAYYEAHKNEDVPEKHYFEKIADALDEITKMELEILELKKVRRCPKCGAEVSDTAEFCSSCGEKLGVVVGKENTEEASDDTDKQPAEDIELEDKPEENSDWL